MFVYWINASNSKCLPQLNLLSFTFIFMDKTLFFPLRYVRNPVIVNVFNSFLCSVLLELFLSLLRCSHAITSIRQILSVLRCCMLSVKMKVDSLIIQWNTLLWKYANSASSTSPNVSTNHSLHVGQWVLLEHFNARHLTFMSNSSVSVFSW